MRKNAHLKIKMLETNKTGLRPGSKLMSRKELVSGQFCKKMHNIIFFAKKYNYIMFYAL